MSGLDRFLATFMDGRVAAKYLPDLLVGLLVTLSVGVAVIVTGLAVGLALTVIRAAGVRAVNAGIRVGVDVLRALPPLALILLIYFGLPGVGIVLPSFLVLWLSLSAVLAAFAEEVFWAGMTAVAPGQWLAARATGLTFWQTLLAVVLPQAVRIAVPPLTNRTIAVTKNLALGSAIGVNEILGRAISAESFSGNATPLTLGAGLYLVVFLPLVAGSRWLERRFRWKRA